MEVGREVFRVLLFGIFFGVSGSWATSMVQWIVGSQMISGGLRVSYRVLDIEIGSASI